jgi:hypothetical protein
MLQGHSTSQENGITTWGWTPFIDSLRLHLQRSWLVVVEMIGMDNVYSDFLCCWKTCPYPKQLHVIGEKELHLNFFTLVEIIAIVACTLQNHCKVTHIILSDWSQKKTSKIGIFLHFIHVIVLSTLKALSCHFSLTGTCHIHDFS